MNSCLLFENDVLLVTEKSEAFELECNRYVKILGSRLSLSWRGVPASFLLLDNISRPMLKAAIPDRFPVHGSRTEKSLT